MDVNDEFARALTRPVNADEMRLSLLAFTTAQAGLDDTDRQELAAELDDATDDQIAREVLAFTSRLRGMNSTASANIRGTSAPSPLPLSAQEAQ